MVKSISCPTAETTGSGHTAMARATTSSLKFQRSSMDPPPRPTINTSHRGKPKSSGRPILSIALAISISAPFPCTLTGSSTTLTQGARRDSTLSMSCKAAPDSDVTIPTVRGKNGRGFLRFASNNPSSCKRRLSCSNFACKSPAPARSTCLTMTCNCPRASYTLASANTRTFAPSIRAVAPSRLAAENITH